MNRAIKRHFGLADKIWFEFAQFLPALPFAGRRILFIEHKVPELDIDAGSRANLDFLKALVALGYEVHFLQTRSKGDPHYQGVLDAIGIELRSLPGRYAARWLKKNAPSYGFIVFSRPEIAERYLSVAKHPATKTILFGHDIHFQRLQRQAEVIAGSTAEKEIDELEATERSLWLAVDLSLYLSREETDEIKRIEPSAKAEAIIPYCWDDFVARTAAPVTTNLLFVAGFGHAPNSDAAVWFAQHVLPLVSSKIPRVKLILAGSNPTADVIRLANESVEVTGRLSEEKLAALYHQSRVAVVPLRFGAGVKLKVVEALYFGLPLVTTPIGTQGLQEIDSIVTATLDPEAMAASILQLLHDDALWLKKSQAQTAYAKEQFSRIAYNARVGAILDNL